MTDNLRGTVVDLETVPPTVPNRPTRTRKSRNHWHIVGRFSGTVASRPNVPASPYLVRDAGRSGGTTQARRCKYAALTADMDPAQAAELDRRLARPMGEHEVVRVLHLAGLALHASTAYRHRAGLCRCSTAEGTTS